jgi:hypothetical protein
MPKDWQKEKPLRAWYDSILARRRHEQLDAG